MRKILRKLMILGIVSSLTAGVISGCGQETKAESASREKTEKAETEKGKSEAKAAEEKPGTAVSEGLCWYRTETKFLISTKSRLIIRWILIIGRY